MHSHRLTPFSASTSRLEQRWKHLWNPWKRRSIPAMLGGGVLVLVAFGVWSVWLPEDTIARGVQIQAIDLSGKSAAEAAELLKEIPTPPNRAFQVTFEDKTWQKSTDKLQESLHISRTVHSAMSVGRTGPWGQQLQERWSSLWNTTAVAPRWQFSAESVQEWVSQIQIEVDQAGEHPAVQLKPSLTVNPGQRGLALESEKLTKTLESSAGLQNEDGGAITFFAPVEVTITPLSADGITAAEARAKKLLSTKLQIQGSDIDAPQTILASEFFEWLSWPTGFNEASMEAQLRNRIASWSREPVSAEFELSPDKKKLTKFAPHRDGQTVEYNQLMSDLKFALTQAETAPDDAPQPVVVQAKLHTAPPETTLADLNTLGIKERIALGTSTYAGSIPNRVFNVQHTAQLIHGTVIAPGDEFSFNEEVGDISGATGFKAAYVIKDGRTQLGDGGGVCQVSTTIFRAVLNGGLPITRWKAHSYRVGYYEQGSQPGFDATVYAPSVDFRFRNDTGHSVALAAYADSEARTLRVELWGTHDGRTAEVSDYKMWNQRGAPAPLFVNDPSLPAGRRQQIDWAASGANASFKYVAKDKDGGIIQDREFVSVFRPWQAVYLVGTGGQ